MNLSDLIKKIEASKDGVTADERIDFVEALTEAEDLVSQGRELLAEIPEKMPEDEGTQDARTSFIDSLMGKTIDLGYEPEGVEISGKIDAVEFVGERGLWLAGEAKVEIPFGFAKLAGNHKVSIDVQSVSGAWDKGDYVRMYIGKHKVYEVKDKTPTAGIQIENIRLKPEDFLDIQIEVGCNNSGGSKAGAAEFICFGSVKIEVSE